MSDLPIEAADSTYARSVCHHVSCQPCLDAQRVGHDGVYPLAEGIKLLVVAPHDVVFEQVTRPPVVLKQHHVELHGEI